MKKSFLSEVSGHLAHYGTLGGIFAVSLWGLLAFSYDQWFQSGVAISCGIAFVVWGVIHHYIHGYLHPKVILEYIATAVLGIVVLLSIIWKV